MNDLHNWVETVDQLVVSIAIIFEFLCFISKQLEDDIGRLAVLELLSKGVYGKIYPSLLDIVS